MRAGNIKERSIWQISGGPTDRPYVELCLRFGVALIGPGDAGPWKQERLDEDFEGRSVRRFALELRLGDSLLLRTGSSTIHAIGVVASNYQYLPQFDDVNGLDRQHGRRVRWFRLPEPYVFDNAVFGAMPSNVTRVNSREAIDYTNRFMQSPPTDWQSSGVPDLPSEEQALVSTPKYLTDLVAQVQTLVPLYWDKGRFGERPMEDELLAHYVVPLLISLGWPPEKIAVKWRNVDVTLFSKLPRVAENCSCLIEAKRLGVGVEGALDQVVRYATTLGKHCDVVVTDGIRYRMYDAKNNFAPIAYANLTRLKQSSTSLFERLKPSM